MNLTDKELLEVYYSALELGLDDEFIEIVEEEIETRHLTNLLKMTMVPR